MKRVLITGSEGLLGRYLLDAGDHDTYEFIDSDNTEGYIDITNPDKLKNVVNKFGPIDVIIHAAALTNVDECEMDKNKCYEVNFKGTSNLLNIAGRNTLFVFLSTDYIFDGREGQYTETDIPHPISWYGECKLKSERIIQKSGLRYLIIRTTVLYGVSERKLNFATWIIRELREKREVSIVDDQWGNPTNAKNVAIIIYSLIKNGSEGIFNVAGKDYINRYEFALKIAKHFNLDSSLIKPISTIDLKQVAKRPLKGGLNLDKVERALGMNSMALSEGIDILKNDMGVYK